MIGSILENIGKMESMDFSMNNSIELFTLYYNINSNIFLVSSALQKKKIILLILILNNFIKKKKTYIKINKLVSLNPHPTNGTVLWITILTKSKLELSKNLQITFFSFQIMFLFEEMTL